MEIIDSISNRMGLNELEKIKPLKDISDKIGVKAGHLGLGVVTVLALLVIFEYGATFISFSVGFLYPAYMSFKAVETKGNKDDDRLWLTYWVVFGFVHVFDDFLGRILSFLPLYNVLKIAFYIWLFHPKTKGALSFYNKVLKGLLSKYETDIDDGLQKLKDKVDEAKPLLERATKALKTETTTKKED